MSTQTLERTYSVLIFIYKRWEVCPHSGGSHWRQTQGENNKKNILFALEKITQRKILSILEFFFFKPCCFTSAWGKDAGVVYEVRSTLLPALSCLSTCPVWWQDIIFLTKTVLLQKQDRGNGPMVDSSKLIPTHSDEAPSLFLVADRWEGKFEPSAHTHTHPGTNCTLHPAHRMRQLLLRHSTLLRRHVLAEVCGEYVVREGALVRHCSHCNQLIELRRG